MEKEIVMKDNVEFEYILNDFFGSRFKRDKLSQKDWNNSNVIIIEKDSEKWLRQTRYYNYDVYKSRLIDEEDYEYIMSNQTGILYIYEDGSYNIYNAEV